MKLRENKAFRIIVLPFLITFLGLLPWWLLAKFVVRTDLASSPYLIGIFIIMWLTVLYGRLLREKPEKEREQITWNIASGYFGKVMPVYFGIALFILLTILMAAIFKK